MSKILVITNEVPYPPHKNGVTNSLFNYIGCWKDIGYDIELIYLLNQDKGSEYELENMYSVHSIFIDLKGTEIFKNLYGELFLKPRNCWNLKTKKASSIDCSEFDYVIIGCLGATLILDKLYNVTGQCIFFAADSSTMYYERSFTQTNSILRKFYLRTQILCISKLERMIYEKVDKTVFVSEVDYKFVSSRFSGTFSANPIGVKIPKKSVKIVDENLKIGVIKFGFSGIMDYEPNSSAVEYILKEIMPRLDERGLKYQMHIIGKNAKPEWSQLDYYKEGKLIITGFLDEIESYISNMDIYLSPLFLGSGMKNKILQAMGIGVPIICSRVSVEGINELVEGINYFEADNTVEEWINKIMALVYDTKLQKQFSEKCKKIVEEKYSWRASAERILEEL